MQAMEDGPTEEAADMQRRLQGLTNLFDVRCETTLLDERIAGRATTVRAPRRSSVSMQTSRSSCPSAASPSRGISTPTSTGEDRWGPRTSSSSRSARASSSRSRRRPPSRSTRTTPSPPSSGSTIGACSSCPR
jgi:hypothetical protein